MREFCVSVCGVLLLGVAFLFPVPAVADGQDVRLSKAWEAYNIGHYKETIELLGPLAVDGNPTAQTLLGRCYESGLGVAQDLEKAVEWYRLAAEQNDAQGQILLAYCYEQGLGVAKDTDKTRELMLKAAESGHPEAQFNCALYASKGLYGVAKDPVQSFTYAKRAADQGYAQAERYVGACYEYGVGTEMNQELAETWYAKAKAKGLEKEGNIFKTVHSLP